MLNTSSPYLCFKYSMGGINENDMPKIDGTQFVEFNPSLLDPNFNFITGISVDVGNMRISSEEIGDTCLFNTTTITEVDEEMEEDSNNITVVELNENDDTDFEEDKKNLKKYKKSKYYSEVFKNHVHYCEICDRQVKMGSKANHLKSQFHQMAKRLKKL